MKSGDGGDEGRPVIQVYGPTPFKFNKEKYVAVSHKNGLKVFQLFGIRRDTSQNTPTTKKKTVSTKKKRTSPLKPFNGATSTVECMEVTSPTAVCSPIGEHIKDVASPTAGCSTIGQESRSSAGLGSKSQSSPIPGDEHNLSDGLGSETQSVTESAVEVDPTLLPFVVNWSGDEVKPMEVNDKECLYSMVKIVEILDLLKPTVPGLGVCLLSEYGRFLLYNILVDDDPQEFKDSEDEDDDDPKDVGEEEFVGYKQMLLVLHSNGIDTGKSTCSDIILRIYHGFKNRLQGTISFDSAKKFLEKGHPIVIDDYNNDDVGKVLVSRISKAAWGKAEINLKQHTYVPMSSLMFSTNEDITALKVEGKNKDEIYRKLSVVDLGEDTMNTQLENKKEAFRDIKVNSRNIRKHLASFYGIMLGVHGKFISSQDFILYEDLTKYERLANLLHNAHKLHAILNSFCERESLEKPRSLAEKLNTLCLTNKSELSHKIRNPDQVVAILIKTESLLVPTSHDEERGLAFQRKSIENYPWCKNTLQLKKNGVLVFTNLRSRVLKNSQNKKEGRGVFIGYRWLKEDTIQQVKGFLKVDRLIGIDEEEEEEEEMEIVPEDPADALAVIFKKEFDVREKMRKQGFLDAKESVKKLLQKSIKSMKKKFPCGQCGKICQTKGGLSKHSNTHLKEKNKNV